METRLIVAYLLIALMAGIFIAWGLIATRKRREKRRIERGRPSR